MDTVFGSEYRVRGSGPGIKGLREAWTKGEWLENRVVFCLVSNLKDAIVDPDTRENADEQRAVKEASPEVKCAGRLDSQGPEMRLLQMLQWYTELGVACMYVQFGIVCSWPMQSSRSCFSRD